MARRDRVIEEKAVAAVSAFSDYMRKLIRERQNNLSDDLLSELIRAKDEGGKLSEDEGKKIVTDFTTGTDEKRREFEDRLSSLVE